MIISCRFCLECYGWSIANLKWHATRNTNKKKVPWNHDTRKLWEARIRISYFHHNAWIIHPIWAISVYCSKKYVVIVLLLLLIVLMKKIRTRFLRRGITWFYRIWWHYDDASTSAPQYVSIPHIYWSPPSCFSIPD